MSNSNSPSQMELVHITTDAQGVSVVSARELYSFLEVKSKFADWFRSRVEKYQLIEGQDFTRVSKILDTLGGAQEGVDYALTLDCAKELSMVQNNPQGKQARQYFIDCEKRLRSTALQHSLGGPSPQQLQQQSQLLLAHQQQIEQLRSQVDQLLAGQRPRRAAPLSLSRQMVLAQVEQYASLSGASAGEVYNWLYDRLQQVFDVDLWQLPRQEGESLLDVADRYDCMHRLLGLIESELHYSEE